MVKSINKEDGGLTQSYIKVLKIEIKNKEERQGARR